MKDKTKYQSMSTFNNTNVKQRFSLRKKGRSATSVLLGLSILSSAFVPTVAEAKPIHDHELTEIPSEESVAPAKYAVIAGFSDKTEFSQQGDEWISKTNQNGHDYHTQVEPADNKKGNLSVTYTNIGNFKGKDLDLKITVKDWKKAGFKGGEFFSFADNHIGFHQSGYDYVDLGFEYIYSESGEPATDLTGTYMTVVDIDALQGMGFDEKQMKNIGKVYAPAESEVDINKKDDGYTYFEDVKNQTLDTNDPKGHFTILADGHTLDFKWAKDWSEYNKDKVIDWEAGQYEQYFGYTAEKPVRTEVLDPAKLVTDSDEVDVLENQLKVIYERYEYDISHTVPAEYPEFFYKEYIMEDVLNDVLETGEVTVFNENDEDVTDLFEDLSEGNHIKFKAKEDTLKDKSFYGHSYRFNVKTNIKADADLSSVTDDDGSIQIPNKATITKDGKEQKDTETTITHVPTPVDPSVDKTIINADGEDVTENEVNVGDQFQYRVTATFPNKQHAEKLGIFDDVPDALAVDSVVVLDEAGNDITEQGTLDINNENESFRWTANDPTEFAGQTIQVIPTVSVKDTVSFAEFEEDGKFVFKNTAQLFVDDETLDSPEVTTTLEKVDPEINKGIVTEDGLLEENEVSIDDTFEYQIDTTYGNETVPSILGLQDDVPDGFNLDSVVVFDADGNDVTEQGTLEIDEEKESFKWTANDPKQFVGKSLNTTVQVTVKDDFDFTEFKDDEDSFVFENTAQMITSDSEGNEKYDDSNPVVSKMKRVDNAIVKKIIDKEGNEVEENQIERGETYTYKVSQTITNEKNVDSISFYDDLEDALDVIKTEVYLDEDVDLEVVPQEDSAENIEKEEPSEENTDTENEADEVESQDEETSENKEVASEYEKAEEETTDETVESESQENTEKDSETEEAQKDNTEVESEESTDKNTIDTINVEVDEDQSIVSWNVEESSNDLKGKTVVTEMEVTLPEDAELNEELVDGDNYIIPNVAKGTVNDDELESNEVRTLVEKEPEEVPPAETPEEPKQPENPPKDPSQVKTPPQKEGWLPHTGTEVNYLIVLGGALLAGLGGWRLYRIRKEN
ncbi:hypothetical protein HMPREF2767_02930 [Nosocomiicoccus sp. HMSC067E10]|uniref:isopeptide-forming domain-containing fimbrial protein n=1 Tax=Nosocomiicoccus sp. HMSC067E10 TaxID=1739271 RepID=UPI0008A4DB09|nr:isopeptide-forming domain-containing fimbrial protein [Nosocomiicoccus sp. HMSC067E10]OFL47376.1 hypothetical protein HMPREF2767_02930 [Nosocomiicoccus sp. HMSC067E10]